MTAAGQEHDEEDWRQISLIIELEAGQVEAARSRVEAWLYHFLPKTFPKDPGAVHRQLYSDVEAMLWQRPVAGDGQAPELRDAAAYALPRGHGKTTTLVIGLVLWCIYEWRSMPHFKGVPPFILIVSDTVGQARDRALDIRDQIESNRRLRMAYGDKVPDSKKRWKPPDDDPWAEPEEAGTFKWTETDFTTSEGVRIMAVGSGSKVRGLLRNNRRPTLIVCDDMENDEHVDSREQRDDLQSWLTKALIPTGLQGEVLTLLIGTILHADSLLSRLLKPDLFVGWLKRRYAAQYDDNGLPSADGQSVLWPGQWPFEKLRARRRLVGSIAYAQEYLNVAVDESTTLFRRLWLEAALRRGTGRRFLYSPPARIPYDVVLSSWDPQHLITQAGTVDAYQYLVTAWDLAIVDDAETARTNNSDYTVGITVGLTAWDRLEVRRVWRRRGLTPNDVRLRVQAEQDFLQADAIVLENNAAQKVYEIDLKQIAGLPLPIKGHTTTRRKHHVFEGVPGLSVLFETGRMDLCWDDPRERSKLEVLVDELHGLGQEAHDDTVMALWMAICRIRRWMRVRDVRRQRLLGPPPKTYINPFPTREAA